MGRPMIPSPMNPTTCAMTPPRTRQVVERKQEPGPVNTRAAASSQGRSGLKRQDYGGCTPGPGASEEIATGQPGGSPAHELTEQGDPLTPVHRALELVGDPEDGVVDQHLDVLAEGPAAREPQRGIQLRMA